MTLESPTNRRSHSSATPSVCPSSTRERTRISASTSNLCLRMSTLASNPSAMQSPPDCFRSQPIWYPDYREGTELTYLHGVAVGTPDSAPEDLADVIDVEAGTWAVFTPLPAAFPKHCRRPGRRRQLSGFRRIRGSCGPGPRSLRSSTGQRTSARPPPSSGCRSNARDTMPLPKGASAVTSWFSLRCVR